MVWVAGGCGSGHRSGWRSLQAGPAVAGLDEGVEGFGNQLLRWPGDASAGRAGQRVWTKSRMAGAAWGRTGCGMG